VDRVLKEVTFGQFIAAVILADRIDKPLANILSLLTGDDNLSLGQIIKSSMWMSANY
jgi:ABC-type bacteriocin/lantibiotic exporter with double-glycine peptidase domain